MVSVSLRAQIRCTVGRGGSLCCGTGGNGDGFFTLLGGVFFNLNPALVLMLLKEGSGNGDF